MSNPMTPDERNALLFQVQRADIMAKADRARRAS